MHGGPLPIPPKDPALCSVKIQLVHPEQDQPVFGLPLLLVGVLVPHAQPLHDPAASRIADVMRRGQIGDAVPPYLFDDCPPCLCGDPPVPEFPAEPVAEIVAVI